MNGIEMKKYLKPLREVAAQLPHPQANWGNMDFQNMIEHLGFAFELVFKNMHCVTPPEKIPRQQAFLRTDKPMPHNFRFPYLPEEPLPHKYASVEKAIEQLENTIERYEAFWKENPEATAVHPVFGEMGLELWDRTHLKHIQHHFEQFSIAH